MSRPAGPPAVRPLVAAALAAGLLGLSGCTAAHQSADPLRTAGAGAVTGAGAESGGGSAAPGTGNGNGTPNPSAAPGAAASGGSAVPGREQGPAPTAPAVVTLPGLDAAAAAPAPAAGPVIAGPAPATAQRNGGVVTGFPVHAVPVPKGVTVVSSSVSSEGNRVQLGMEASSGASPAEVLNAYDEAFGATGFTPSSSPALAGTSAHAYQHGSDGLVVTVRARLGGGTEIAVAGTVTAAG